MCDLYTVLSKQAHVTVTSPISTPGSCYSYQSHFARPEYIAYRMLGF